MTMKKHIMKLKEKNFMQINKQQNDEEETCNET
jgi:hypothetical protein